MQQFNAKAELWAPSHCRAWRACDPRTPVPDRLDYHNLQATAWQSHAYLLALRGQVRLAACHVAACMTGMLSIGHLIKSTAAMHHLEQMHMGAAHEGFQRLRHVVPR